MIKISYKKLKVVICILTVVACASAQQYEQQTELLPSVPETVPEPTAIIKNSNPKSETQQQSKPAIQNTEDDGIKKEMDILAYGLDSEISDLIAKYINEDIFYFSDQIQKVFDAAKSDAIKQKCIEYFTAAEDPRLKEYALAIAQDPYDAEKDLVASVFKYISVLKFTEAAPYARKIIDDENKDYFDAALNALGRIGRAEDAQFLADFLDRPDMSTARRQSLMKVLGKLHAIETSDKLISIAEDENENTFVRMYAAEALGEMKNMDALPVLIELYNASDPNLRASVIRALKNYSSDEDAKSVIEQALRDNHYKVRLEAIAAIKSLKLVSAGDSLIYRAKNDPESVVKYACYDAVASLNLPAGNDFLISVVKDTKKGETAQVKAASALLQYGNAGTEVIIALAEDTLKDDKKKNLRYALGKEFAKHINSSFSGICQNYLDSKDVSTQGIGLDIYARNRFAELTTRVQEIAEDDKAGPNKVKAQRILSASS